MGQIRLWKLGDYENKILPTKEVLQKFAKLLRDNPKATDIVWDRAITVEIINTPDDRNQDIVAVVE